MSDFSVGAVKVQWLSYLNMVVCLFSQDMPETVKFYTHLQYFH